MRTSIVIPAKRDSEIIKKCLDSIEKHTKDYEVIIEENGTYSEAVNNGLKKAKGDYIILLHDDCEVTKGWADKLIDCGAFRIGELDDTLQIYGGYYPNEGYCQDGSPDYSMFICLSKDVIKDIGKFDEFYKSPWCFDVEMGMHLKSKGYKLKPLEGKVIHHHMGGKHSDENRSYLERKWL